MIDPVVWQPSLLGWRAGVAVDGSFSGLTRIELDERSWIELAPGWVGGSDELFAELVQTVDWGQRERRVYDRVVTEPRLTAHWDASGGTPLAPPILETMRATLSERYGVELDSAGLNLYRDGRDSVAWHRDRIAEEVVDPLVILVSLGHPRRFLVRRRGGGPSRPFLLGDGDLLVTGGRFQRGWEHAVPKVAAAGPRISIAFRHGLIPASRGKLDAPSGA